MKRLKLAVAFLVLLSGAAAQSIQVEGLEEESIDTELREDGVHFETDYLDKTVSYRDVFIPEEYQQHLNGFSASYKQTPGVSKLSIDYSFNQPGPGSSLPSVLHGYQYQADFQSSGNGNGGNTKWSIQSSLDVVDDGTGDSLEEDADYDMVLAGRDNVARVDGSLNRKRNGQQLLNDAPLDYEIQAETFAFDTGLLKPRVSSHYEHLIIEHEARSSVDPSRGRAVDETQQVFSGEDTERLPVTGSVEQRSAGRVTQEVTKDNLYEPETTEKLVVAYKPRTEISSVDFNGLKHERLGQISYNEDIRPELQDNKVSTGRLDNPSQYKFAAWNVTYPADSQRTVQVNFSQPVYNPLTDNPENYEFNYFSYILGSVATFKTDTSSEWNSGSFSFTQESGGDLEMAGKDLEVPYVDTSGNLKYVDASGNTVDLGVQANDAGGVADIDSDSRKEVAYVDTNSNLKNIDVSGDTGDFGGGFAATDAQYVGDFGDIDSDGSLEVAFVTNGDFVQAQDTSGNRNSLTSGDNAGAMADVDGDGDLDVIFAEPTLSFVDVNQNSNEFGPTTSIDRVGGLADFDGDGDLDAAYADGGTLFFQDNSGNEVTLSSDQFFAGGFGDIDGDGTLEMAAADLGSPLKIFEPSGNSETLASGGEKPGFMGDVDGNGDSKDFGSYSSAVFSASEEKIYENVTVSNFDKNGGTIDITVETSNDGFSTVLESDTVQSSELSSSGTQTVDLALSKGATDVRYSVSLDGTTITGPSIDSIEIDGRTANSPPSVDTTSVTPDPPNVGQTADFSYTASDPDGTVTSVDLVLKDDGTQIFSGTKSAASGTFNPPDTLTDGTVTAEYTATDDFGATDTATLTRTLSETAPSTPTVNDPGSTTFNVDDIPFNIQTQDDGDDKPNEDLTCTITEDGTQKDQRTVTEGSSYSGSYVTSGEGSHTFKVVCEESDGETSSQTVSYSVDFKAPSADSTSLSPSPFEFGETVSASITASDNVEVTEITAEAFKESNTLNSVTKTFSSSSVSTTFTDLFTADETGKNYTVEYTIVDNQGKTTTVTEEQELVNFAPTVDATSSTPSPALIGENVSFSASVSDQNKNHLDNTQLEVTFDGATVFTGTETGGTVSFNDVVKPGSEGFLNATFTVTDKDGKTSTATLSEFLTDNTSDVSFSSSQTELFDYDESFTVQTTDDQDSAPQEPLQCNLVVDGSTIDTRTVTEGDSYTVTDRNDLGSHSADVTCTEQLGDSNTDSDTRSFDVKAFEFQGTTAQKSALETSTQDFQANVKHGDMVQNVNYSVDYDGGNFGQFTRSYTGIGTASESTSFRIPLVSTDGKSASYNFRAEAEIKDFKTGEETVTRLGAFQSQTVNFAYENASITVQDPDVIEDTDFTRTVSFDNALQSQPANITAQTTFNGSTINGFSNTYTAPLVQQANTTKTVTGSIQTSFRSRTDTRTASTDNVKVFRKILTTCTNSVKGVNGPQAQKIVLKNETEQSIRVQGDIEYNYDVSAPGSSHTRNYAFTETNTQTATTCLYPDFAEYQISGPVSYEASGFGKRVLRLKNTTVTNSTTTLPLFLLPDTESTDTIIRAETPSGSPIDGTVKVLRFDVGTNTFTQAAKLETGTDGETEVGLEDGAFYEFVVQQDGQVIFTRDQEQFTPQTVPATVTLTVGQELPDFVENQDGFTFKVEEVKNNGNITGLEATVNHDTSALQNATLKVDKNAVIGENTICEKTVQTSASTLFCDFNETAEGNQFSFVLSSFVQGDRFVLQTGSIDKTKGLFGINQVFAGFLVFMSLSAFGFVTPRLTVMFSTAGVIAAYTLGLISVGVGAMASLVAVALIVTFAGERTV